MITVLPFVEILPPGASNYYLERAAMNQNATPPLPITENQARFRELVEQALSHAKTLGASDAVAEVSESQGLSVSVRKLALETVEQTRDRALDVTVYAGQCRGSASTSDFSPAALRDTVEAAWHIAKYTAADPAAGLPDAALLEHEAPDLRLHHPRSEEHTSELQSLMRIS